MITPAFLLALSLDGPGSGILQSGISEGAVGQPAILPNGIFLALYGL
jgi:hypothetical protein